MVSPIDNLLQYVRIKTTFIAAQMSESDAQHIIEHIIGEVRSFLKEYPFEATVSAQSRGPSGMSEAIWKTLCKVQPSQAIIASDIDRLSTCELVPSMIEDGDPEWVLKWWKANTFAYPLMA